MQTNQELLDALEHVLDLAWDRVETVEDDNAVALIVAHLMELEHANQV